MTSVIITAIICFTVIVVFLISALTRCKDENEQRVKDAYDLVREFTDEHYYYDKEKGKMRLTNASEEEMCVFLNALRSILL